MRLHREGRLLDERRRPLPGLTVAAEARVGAMRERLGQVETGPDGRFLLDLRVDSPVEGVARVGLVVLDALGARELWRGDPPPGGDVVLPRALAQGWLATGGGPSPLGLDDGCDAELLVDDEQFEAIERDVNAARESVWCSQLLFFPDFAPASGRPLVETFLAAAGRGADVCILLNENAVVPDTCAAIERALAADPR
ncbi:MAG TPA: hypothetical protein VHH36_04565, partial [Candidatus Thermoplasmatota archaeon]|nr:hypothetical protein [Candidatus Thermoplasmatota archaeon]